MTYFLRLQKYYILSSHTCHIETGDGMGDARITLRINDVELDEIDDFIARHPEYHNRSEFVRQIVMEHIKNAEREEYANLSPNTEFENQLYMALEEYIEYRYFTDMHDLITYVFRNLLDSGKLHKILKEHVTRIKSLHIDESLLPVRGRLVRHEK